MDMDEISKLTESEKEALFLEYVAQMSKEDQEAMEQLVKWLAYEKPKDFEFTSMEQVQRMLVDIKRKNARRRLGVRYGTILPFKKPQETE